MTSQLVGYFDNYSSVPTYDPPLNCPCIICGKIMEDGTRMTVSVCMMPYDHPDRSYFYRAHKACYESTPEADISEIEGAILNI